MSDTFGAEYHREYYKKRRQAIFDYLGQYACVDCGSEEDLEIDHIDPSTKAFSVNTRMSVKNNSVELDKCQVLCRKCHQAKTARENSGFRHGTVYGWMKKKKCMCAECQDHKSAWNEARNARRRKAA